jgi:hypothetical protein
MQGRVLILGGYGNFGKRIAKGLTRSGVSVIVAGRSRDKAKRLKQQLPSGLVESVGFDVSKGLDEQLAKLNPKVVINTCGPFQDSDYAAAEACIRQNVHYVDLADGRDFVTGISKLNTKAIDSGIAVISGASTVPGLSSAVLEHFKNEFSKISSLRYGISPGQKAERGLATTQAILSYVGKPLKPFPSGKKSVYGWQDIYSQNYPGLGRRWMASCDIPDLDLLPERYGIDKIQFSAGLELGFMHLGLWGLSWLVRAGLPLNLPRLASPLLMVSNWFNGLGSADGGMHMIISGEDQAGSPLSRSWFIVAKDGHGPHIPAVPAIILARQLVNNEIDLTGALPCVGLVDLDTYVQELSPYDIKTYVR